ncbi:hypothetical protein HMPREF9582_01486 [Cutibacterium acnes HL060PA1]|nr:hypothetical protein HMPREF9582_01486 [Cutibacterium acnes HL060PA1]
MPQAVWPTVRERAHGGGECRRPGQTTEATDGRHPACCRVEHGDKGLDECLEGAFTLTSLKSFVSHHFTFLLMSTSGAHHGQGSSS